MIRSLLLATLAICLHFSSAAQKVTYINSGEVIEKADALFDSAKYTEAIKEYLKVPEVDTNYVYMLNRIIGSYFAAEQFDEVIKTCDKGLSKPSRYKTTFLRIRALAVDRKGNYQEALKQLEKSIAEHPTDVGLRFGVALIHANNKNFDKATDQYFSILRTWPYHTGSHINLALLAIRQGRKTQGMLAMGMYLCINNTDNPRLVLLNNFVDNQVTDEGSLAPIGMNGAEKLDQIIRAKIALDKNFKSEIDFNAPLVRQYELLFQQLSMINTDANDPYVNYYLPVYKAIKEQGANLAFIYHILASSSNDTVRKWRGKNEKALDTFFDIVNSGLSAYRKKITLPSLNINSPVSAWYRDNNLNSVGEVNAEDKPVGPWIYFHTMGFISAKGTFGDDGKKKGTWQYYNTEGQLKSVENFENGEVTLYYPSGSKRKHFFLKDNEADGEVELFYDCDMLSEKISFKAGQRHGKGRQFYADGKPKLDFEYDNGKAVGATTSYDETGAVYNKRLYQNDMIHGPYKIYFPNGKLMVEGEYLNDEEVGTWTYYHSNGKIDYTGKYEKGTGVGEWSYYDRRGNLIETRIFNEKGELNGDNIIYEDGKKYFVNTFKNGVLVKIACYDAAGKELSKGGNDKGTFPIKGYYPTGQLRSEGGYLKGKRNGIWKYYFRNGKIDSEYTYKDGLIEGQAKEYFESGEIRYISNYMEGELHGYFQEFYSHGQLKSEGYYQDGNHEQQWLTYHANGKLESDYYYRNNEYHGKCFNYDLDGKTYSAVVYDEGKIKDLLHYDPVEKQTSKTEGEKTIVVTDKYKDGKLRHKYEILCGEYTNTITKWYPDGKVFYSYGIVNGKRNGPHTLNYIEGTPATKGMNVDGEEEGIWINYYADGKISSTGSYVHGKSDSTWIYYFPDGKVSMITEYADDERHGINKIFTPDGELRLEKLYQHGDLIAYRLKKDDPWTPFTGTGKILVKYPDGKTAIEEDYKDFMRSGVKRLLYGNGNLYEETNYKNGDFEGAYTFYYSDGKPREKGVYKLDEREGVFEYYDANGKLRKTETYLAGSRNGKVTLYADGGKTKEFTFRDGMPQE